MFNIKNNQKPAKFNIYDNNHELDDNFDLNNLSENISLNSSNRNDSALLSKMIKKNKSTGFIFNLNINNEENEEIDNAEDEAEYDIDQNELYLSIFYQNSKLACCYYDSDKKTLFTLTDIQENLKYEITKLLINDLNPTTIISCSKCDPKFLRFIKIKSKYEIEDQDLINQDLENLIDRNDNVKNHDEDCDLTLDQSNKYPVREKQINIVILSSNDFNYNNGKTKIIEQLNDIDQMPANMSQAERIIYFSGLFDFESKLLIKTVGGLLKYFDRSSASLNLSNDILFNVQILAVRPVCLDKILLFDSNTYKSLQIFNNVDYVCAHKLVETLEANNFRTSFNDKFNNTLYGLYSTKIQTKIGMSKLRSYFMKPIRDENVLNKRYKVVEFFINNKNNDLATILMKKLKKCKFINQILKRMRIAKCNLNEWKRLYHTTHAFLDIAKLSFLINERMSNIYGVVDLNKNSNKIETFQSRLFKNFQFKKTKYYEISSTLEGADDEIKRDVNSETPCLTNTDNFPSIRGSYYSNKNLTNDKENNDTIFSYIINKDFASKFENLIDLFDRIIDLKESNENKKCKINANISSDLDEKKQTYAKLSEYLTKVARQELEKANLTECHVIYIPLHGFLLLIKLDSIIDQSRQHELKKLKIFNVKESQSKIQNDENELMDSQDVSNQNDDEFERMRVQFEFVNKLEFLFKSNDQFFYKNDRMRELDNEFGDLFSQINDIESEILEKLQSEFIKCSHLYADMIDLCGELDCLLAFALIAKDRDYTKPNIYLKDSFIYARDVRHPLIELNVENSIFVPNEIKLGQCLSLNEFISDIQTSNKIKVITGPNASGKTVYLKSVALTIFMAMIGSYVPSLEAYIGDFDRIFTRLNSDETVAIQLSSFSIDAKQIAESINGSTYKSLIIIDEFGKGTNEIDGQSLVAALLKYWSDMPKMTSPHILFSTHFYEILRRFEIIDSLKENNLKIDYLTFNFLIDKEELKNELCTSKFKEKLICLFTLRKGVTNSSHAIQIANKVGLDASIIQRASQINDVIKTKLIGSNDIYINEIIDTEFTKNIFKNYKEMVKDFLKVIIDIDEKYNSQIENEEQIKLKATDYRNLLSKLSNTFESFKINKDMDAENKIKE